MEEAWWRKERREKMACWGGGGLAPPPADFPFIAPSRSIPPWIYDIDEACDC